MDTNVILLLLLVPLIGSLVNVFFGKKLGNGSGIIATVAVLISFILSLLAFIQVNNSKQPIEIELFEWMALANFKVNFGFLLESTFALVVVVCYRNRNLDSLVFDQLHEK